MEHRELLVAIVLSLSIAASCAGQRVADSSRPAAEVADELAALAVELGTFDDTLDRGATLAWSSSADALTLELGRELTEAEQERVVAILRASLAEFLTVELWQKTVAGIYAEEFSAAELGEMLRFYSSPVGRKTLERESEITRRVDDRIGEALERRVADFIARVDEALGEEFGIEAGR